MELKKSEIQAVFGQDGPVSFCGLDGKADPKVIAAMQKARLEVQNNMARISDMSPEAVARRAPNVRKNLQAILKYFKDEKHPFYQSRLNEAINGGYLTVPAQQREIILISIPPASPAREPVLV